MALSCLLLGLGLRLNADILTNYTLSGNQTFTARPARLSRLAAAVRLLLICRAIRPHFTGGGDFQINSRIQGTGGQVYIDMTDPDAVVTYAGINSYTGLTTVRSGILNLDTADKSNNGLSAAIVIGGGSNQAILTRPTTGNRNLIKNTASVTLKQNGVFELKREDSGSTAANSSTETIGTLIMDGGTLLNKSANPLATVFVASTLTLSANSIIDLGVATSFKANAVSGWTSGVFLTISNYDSGDTFDLPTLTAGQLAQIRFAVGGIYRSAGQLANGNIVPVPEVSSVLALAFLGITACVIERRRRVRL